jgi:pilus assembly protein CpaF
LLSGSNINSDFVVPTVARSVDLIVHVARDSSGVRRITEIGALTGAIKDGQPECQTLLRWDGTRWHKISENFPRKRAHEVIDLQLLWRGL